MTSFLKKKKVKKIFIILGSVGFVAGLLIFYLGVILIAEYIEYRSTLPPCEYDPDISCIPPMHYSQYMALVGPPITLLSLPLIAYGFVKWKYGYVYMPLIALLLVVVWFAFLFSRG